MHRFRSPRHSVVTNVYRATQDLLPAQRFARRASPLATVIYTHPADEALAREQALPTPDFNSNKEQSCLTPL